MNYKASVMKYLGARANKVLAYGVASVFGVILPLIYGAGTALPVFIFSLLIAIGAGSLAKAFQKVTQFELWARRVTGVIFLVIGIYFTIAYTLGVNL